MVIKTLQTEVTESIDALCPIHGVTFGKLNDKSTWILQYKPESTDEQKRLAQDYLNSFVIPQ